MVCTGPALRVAHVSFIDYQLTSIAQSTNRIKDTFVHARPDIVESASVLCRTNGRKKAEEEIIGCI